MNALQVRRGDVFLASLDPTQGSEQAGTRPVVVLSRDSINQHSSVVLIVPFTDAANKTRLYPSQLRLPAGAGGLSLESIAICEQVRAIAKTRLVRHMGSLTRSQLSGIEEALRIALDL